MSDMSPKIRTVYRQPGRRNGETKLTHKIVVLFTETEATEIIQAAALQDRTAGNFVHYVMREYLAGRLRARA